mmetsp:Transcript_57609/g.171849  ORF Transcript_57609/g.171849 Transcript_57609/m.171849 type:complete len:213 (-) Transcript_57609:1499-2137(-)
MRSFHSSRFGTRTMDVPRAVSGSPQKSHRTPLQRVEEREMSFILAPRVESTTCENPSSSNDAIAAFIFCFTATAARHSSLARCRAKRCLARFLRRISSSVSTTSGAGGLLGGAAPSVPVVPAAAGSALIAPPPPISLGTGLDAPPEEGASADAAAEADPDASTDFPPADFLLFLLPAADLPLDDAATALLPLSASSSSESDSSPKRTGFFRF